MGASRLSATRGWVFAAEYGTTGVGLAEPLKRAGAAVDQVFRSVTGRGATVTFTTNGRHKPGSLHGEGLAVDLRTRGLTRGQVSEIAERLRAVLGRDYDVVDEGDHLHVELDPR